MSATPVRRKVDALLTLAGGSTNRAAAEVAGVSAGTVAAWRKNPDFAAALATLKAVVERRPVDGAEVMEAVDAAERRLTPTPPVVVENGRFKVLVTIPPGASARKVEQLTARAIARGLRAVREARP